jgi:hypothetical protein
MSRQTSLRLTNEFERQLKKVSEIAAIGPDDDPPMNFVSDTKVGHLIQSKEDIYKTPK